MIFTRLSGGHRNDVFKTNGFVKVVWKDGFVRRAQIREGVLLENFVATHTDIKARMLVDKSKPIQEEDGKLVTYFHYVDGEIRYPWSLDEIASAGKLLTRLHRSFGIVKRPGLADARPGLIKRLHLDFARGNVLFQPGTSDAVGVIDFETTAEGPVEQELGRTLSFLLVDTPRRNSSDFRFQISDLKAIKKRINTFIKTYGLPYRKDDVIRWATRYLREEDYGNLNSVRDKAIEFLLHSSPAS